MSAPGLALQGALIAALKGHPDVAALVGDRVYDQPPARPDFPYLSWGAQQDVRDAADCLDGYEIFIQLDGWSRAVGFPEAKAGS